MSTQKQTRLHFSEKISETLQEMRATTSRYLKMLMACHMTMMNRCWSTATARKLRRRKISEEESVQQWRVFQWNHGMKVLFGWLISQLSIKMGGESKNMLRLFLNLSHNRLAASVLQWKQYEGHLVDEKSQSKLRMKDSLTSFSHNSEINIIPINVIFNVC